MTEFDPDDFAAIVRAGGLEDCPPEIAVEITRITRETKEIFARHGVTGDPDHESIETQRAIMRDLKKLMRRPGPKPPELKSGQFERDIILWFEASGAFGKPGGVDSVINGIAGRWGESTGSLRNRYYTLRKQVLDAREKARTKT